MSQDNTSDDKNRACVLQASDEQQQPVDHELFELLAEPAGEIPLVFWP